MDGSSSFSSSHYSNILETVSQLRSDLEKAISKIQSLENQNTILVKNYETIKEELIQTRKKYNEAQDNYMSTVANKIEAERQSEEFLNRLKYELDEKTNEFEKLRDNFTPKDIDYIRIKVKYLFLFLILLNLLI
jgi:predicted  nucleic acid-binding Zn-ribbon protein